MYPNVRHALALSLTAACCVMTMPAGLANHHDRNGGHDHGEQAGEASTGLINGEVRRIDIENRKLTIRHEAIPELEMAAMTMVFSVADQLALDTLRAGDKIRFSIKKSGGKWQVIRLEKVD